MTKKCLTVFIGLFLLINHHLVAQEFDVRLSINFPTLQLADPATFKTLESQLNEFFNGHAWTDLDLKDFEKIKGNINITITKEESPTTFSGEMDVVISRPVYSSDYETTLLNYRDKNIVFSYEPGRPITYSDNSFTDNLSATLAFYAYFILGLDGDSFALYGGDPYFNKAREISDRIPVSMQSEKTGWDQKGNSRNRYRMISEVYDPAMRPFRKAWYNYHRLGLDEMHNDAANARATMLQAMYSLQEVNESEPNSMLVNIFFLAKALELNEVFAVSPRAEKIEAFNLIRSMDAANSQKYDKLLR